MYGNKNDMIVDIDTAITLLMKAKQELQKCETETVNPKSDQYKSPVKYSLAIVKNNCLLARQLTLDVMKSCQERWNETLK